MKNIALLVCLILFLMQTKAQQSDNWKQMQSLGSSATPRTGAVSFSIGGKGYMGLGGEGDFVYKTDFWQYDPITNVWTQKADFPGGDKSGAVAFGIGNKGYVGMGDQDFSHGKKDFWEYNSATNTWTRKADFAGGGRAGATGFSIGKKGYAGLGVQGFSTGRRDFWEYDPATDTWTRKANFKGGIKSGAIGLGIDGKGYVGMGVEDSSGYSIIKKDFWEYDPTTDAWTRKTDIPVERVDAAAFSINNKGYVGTGYNYSEGYLNDLWQYNVVTDRWTEKMDFAGGLREGAIGFSINGKGYIGAGDDGSYLINDFWEYESNTDTWVRKAGFGGIERTGATGFSINGKGYIGTGTGNTGTSYSSGLKDFWEYDTLTKAWTQKADFGGGIRSNATGFSINGKGYIGTGSDGAGLYKKDLWKYDPLTNTWTQKANFGGGVRSGAVSFSIKGKGYIGTGYDPNAPGYYKNDFWEYDPASDTWTKKAGLKGARTGAVGFAIAGKGYVGTGVSENRSFGMNDFWEYDPSIDTWTRKKDFGGLIRSNAVGFRIGNKGYIGTGFAHDSLGYSFNTKDFWEYDPVTDAWTQKAGFGGTARSEATAISIGNYGYLGFGTDYQSSFNDWWQYTPSNISATERGSLLPITKADVDNNSNNFLVYPNPVKSSLHISLNDVKNETVSVRILDINGRQIYIKRINTGAGDFNYDVDVTPLPKGIYTIQLIGQGRVNNANFVKE